MVHTTNDNNNTHIKMIISNETKKKSNRPTKWLKWKIEYERKEQKHQSRNVYNAFKFLRNWWWHHSRISHFNAILFFLRSIVVVVCSLDKYAFIWNFFISSFQSISRPNNDITIIRAVETETHEYWLMIFTLHQQLIHFH